MAWVSSMMGVRSAMISRHRTTAVPFCPAPYALVTSSSRLTMSVKSSSRLRGAFFFDDFFTSPDLLCFLSAFLGFLSAFFSFFSSFCFPVCDGSFWAYNGAMGDRSPVGVVLWARARLGGQSAIKSVIHVRIDIIRPPER